MTLFMQYAANGLAGGFVVALMALSVVLIWRTTRVLSFAQGAIASLTAYVYFQLQTVWGLPVGVAVPLALAAAAATGVAVERLAVRPLRNASPLTRTAATLGVVLVLQVLMRVTWGGSETFIARLSDARLTIGSFSIGAQQIAIAAVAISAAIVLAVWSRRTYGGLAHAAIAEDADAARLLGVNPVQTAVQAWAGGAVLAGLAGILYTPLTVLNPWQMTLIMVTAFGAAMLAGFTSLPVALGGGAVIGVVQSVTVGYTNVSGLSEAFGFIAVFAVLLLTKARAGRSVADRVAGEHAIAPAASERGIARAATDARSVDLSRFAPAALAMLVVAPIVARALTGSDYWPFIGSFAVIQALLALSLVVVAGWSGQLNLHAAALGLGWGAYAGFALHAYGVPPLLAVLAAGAVAAPFALIVALFAVRFRGLELAIATLAMGLIFERLAFRNIAKALARRVTDTATPFELSFVSMPRPRLPGIDLASDTAFYVFCVIVAVAMFLVVHAIGRGATGRALRAVREREVPAETLGVAVVRNRIGAFVGSIAIAATAGALFGSWKLSVAPDSFNLDLSFGILAAVVIGGIRRPAGAIVGGALAALLPELVRFGPFQVLGGERLTLLFGAGMVLALWRMPEGLAGLVARRTREPGDDVVPVRPPLAISPRPRRYATPIDRHARRAALRVEDVTVRFGGVTALDGAGVFVPEGEVCAVIGPNGAGKSTLFNVASGLVAPDAGRVYLGGADVTDLPGHRRAALGLGRTFQAVEVFRDLTVIENVMLGAQIRRHSGPLAEAFALPSSRRDEADLERRARDVLDACGLAAHAGRRPGELPLGVLRVLEIAMALAGEPRVLLLDEPSAGLDEAETETLGDLIAGVRGSTGAAVVLVEHDMSIVGRLAEHVYVLDFGRVIAQGTPDAVRRDPLVVEKYLGARRRSRVKEVAGALR